MDQLGIDFAPPAARSTDHVTAHGAAVIALFNAASNRAKALLALADAGGQGLTDFELASVVDVIQPSIGVRRGELRKQGLVAPAMEDCEPSTANPYGVRPVRRPTPTTGSPAQVWVITADGLLAAEQLRKDSAA